jgi:hypothetical protein
MRMTPCGIARGCFGRRAAEAWCTKGARTGTKMDRRMLHGLAVVAMLWAVSSCGRAEDSAHHPAQPEEAAMQGDVYTLGVWRVRPGLEAEFIAAWKELGEAFRALANPPGPGTLVQSVSDPELFYSFGPWNRLEDIQTMRDDPEAQVRIQRLIELCTSATPGTFRVVAQVPAGAPRVP